MMSLPLMLHGSDVDGEDSAAGDVEEAAVEALEDRQTAAAAAVVVVQAGAPSRGPHHSDSTWCCIESDRQTIVHVPASFPEDW
jgi:hypothetical protein